MISGPPKKPATDLRFIGESTIFPTFKVNVSVPTKGVASSSPKSHTQPPAAKPKAE